MSQIVPLAHLSALSGYGLYLSYHNIWRLQQYEEQSEKAAEWSKAVAARLHKTRSTQTTGTLSLVLSAVTALGLLLAPKQPPGNKLLISLANAAVQYAARTHMHNFWNSRNQTKIPFVQKFNEAISGSERVVKLLSLLAGCWSTAGLVWWNADALGDVWGSVLYGVVAIGSWILSGGV